MRWLRSLILSLLVLSRRTRTILNMSSPILLLLPNSRIFLQKLLFLKVPVCVLSSRRLILDEAKSPSSMGESNKGMLYLLLLTL